MCDAAFLEQLERWQAVFDFTIRGIEAHFEECEPEPRQITDALILLSEQHYKLTSEANERLERARAEK